MGPSLLTSPFWRSWHRSATLLAPSAFLSSAAGCKDLISSLIPSFHTSPLTELALQEWREGHDLSPSSGNEASRQKSWDEPRLELCQQKLLNSAIDNHHRARLLASFTKESGYWLEAPPITSLGLQMDNSVIHIAAGLR